MMDREKSAYKDLAATTCACGKKKARGQSFCKTCYYALSPAMRRALYRSDGYQQSYSAACRWLLRMAEAEDAADGIPSAGDMADDCDDCAEGLPLNCCTASRRECGHHCNHSWTHDICCWCGKRWSG